MFRAEEDTSHEHGERGVPIVDLNLGDRPDGAADASVVEHDVEPTEHIDGELDSSRNVVLDRHIAAGETSGVAKARRGRFTCFCVEVGDDHARALVHEPLGGSQSHTAGCAGDDGHSTVELTASSWGLRS